MNLLVITQIHYFIYQVSLLLDEYTDLRLKSNILSFVKISLFQNIFIAKFSHGATKISMTVVIMIITLVKLVSRISIVLRIRVMFVSLFERMLFMCNLIFDLCEHGRLLGLVIEGTTNFLERRSVFISLK